jgi:hypothetical protein
MANCSAAGRGKTSTSHGNAGQGPATIRVLAADLADITLNDTSDLGDF